MDDRHAKIILIAILLLPAAACREEKDEAPPPPQPTEVKQGATTPEFASRSMDTTSQTKDASDLVAQAGTPATQTASMSERDKIEALIETLAELKGATFVRNGKPHDVSEAVEHVRRKWAWKSEEIETAEDFIRLAATKSSISGFVYKIRFADGGETASADWFRSRLAELEASE